MSLFLISISAGMLVTRSSAKASLGEDLLGQITSRPIALLLGTSKYVARGRPNLFYTRRIRAAARLFHAGKVRAILVKDPNQQIGIGE